LADGPGFIHLNCHSAYSLLEGALPIGKLVKLAVQDGMPALGVTDTANLFGALEFSEKAAAAGLQPIIGCKLPIRFEPDEEYESRRPGNDRQARRCAPVFLLCASRDGYRALIRLVSNYYLGETGRSEPVPIAALAAVSAGLIALTGGHDGPLYSAINVGDYALADGRAQTLREAFGDRLYVSVERHGMEQEFQAEPAILDLAYRLALPLVATNEPFFPTADDYEAHDALLAIAEGRLLSSDDRRRLTPEHHFAGREQMVQRFADLPEALENTVEIALRCRTRPRVVQPILPRFAATASDPETADREEAMELRRQAQEGLAQRLAAHGTASVHSEADYRQRLDFELNVISGMKYPGYFLIVADFIKWAKAQKIPVGPGRGSGAGSVVAWALTITDLDPLRFGLLFERFLNPDRVSMPDFDIDFCQERRDQVIEYVQRRYGADRVAQIITFGTLQARAALRDVGRVLEMPTGSGTGLQAGARDPGQSDTCAGIEGEPRSMRSASGAGGRRLLTIAMKLEGYTARFDHAAGM
jgi:DNA polymerase-3 subunit alpha